MNKKTNRKIGDEIERAYLCNPLLKKQLVLQNVLKYFEKEFEKFKKNFALIQMALTFAAPMKKGEAVKPEDL